MSQPTRSCVRSVRSARPAALLLAIVLGLLPFLADATPVTTRVDWGSKAPMGVSSRRSLALAAAPNGRLYAAGGRVGGTIVGYIEEYDPATNFWTFKDRKSTRLNSSHL